MEISLAPRFFDRLFRDKTGRLVVAQWPNTPLWVWIACKVFGFLLHGTAAASVNAVGTLALAAWAVMELGWGVNLFRRLLGAGVLASIVLTLGVKAWHWFGAG